MFLKSFKNISCLWQEKNICQTYVCMVAKLTNIGFDKQNLKCLSNNVCTFGKGLRLLTDGAKSSRRLFLMNNFFRRHEILPCVTKVVNEKLRKNCCRQQKRIDSFSLFKREKHQMRFSDLPLFLIHNTKYEFVAVFQNSYRSQKVVDEKVLSTWKSCWQHLVLCVYSLKFVSIVTVKVCVCSSPPSKQKCYHKKN